MRPCIMFEPVPWALSAWLVGGSFMMGLKVVCASSFAHFIVLRWSVRTERANLTGRLA
jgi:hypothetical protein